MDHLESQRKYIKSAKGKATRRAYERTPAGIQAKRRANKTYRDNKRADLIHAQAQARERQSSNPDVPDEK